MKDKVDHQTEKEIFIGRKEHIYDKVQQGERKFDMKRSTRWDHSLRSI